MSMRRRMEQMAVAAAALYALDRAWKMAAVADFFRRPDPTAPALWPSVTLVQPVTRGPNDLAGALARRARLDYPARIQHLFVCDAADAPSLAVCHAWLAAHPACDAQIIRVESPPGQIASKVIKMKAALAHADGDVLCFIDDDIGLRPDALRVMVPHLDAPGVGAVFGLACYCDWSDAGSSLMSAFVNANALLSYVPLTYLTEPFTITGHCFALKRAVFDAIGGLDGMGPLRIDDDHELARRVRRAGLAARQTRMIYDVQNRLPSFAAYRAQMKRWIRMPRQAMIADLSPAEQAVTFAGSAGNLLPPLVAALALLSGRGGAWRALGFVLALALALYAAGERFYLKRRTPPARLPLVIVSLLTAPLEVLIALAGDDDIEWRGRRLRLMRGGDAEEL